MAKPGAPVDLRTGKVRELVDLQSADPRQHEAVVAELRRRGDDLDQVGARPAPTAPDLRQLAAELRAIADRLEASGC